MTPHIVLIDGPSGSGKTTLAQQLAVECGKQLVHMDDVYPGWSGLRAGITIIANQVLGSSKPGFFRWDWIHNQPGQHCEVDTTNLIIEGVGALASEIIAATEGKAVGVMLSLPVELRKQRALDRDPDFAPFWDMWAEQEAMHFAQLANIVSKLPILRLDVAQLSPDDIVAQVLLWLRRQE